MGLDGKKLQRHPTPLRRGSVVSQAGDQSLELTDGILVLDAYSVLHMKTQSLLAVSRKPLGKSDLDALIDRLLMFSNPHSVLFP